MEKRNPLCMKILILFFLNICLLNTGCGFILRSSYTVPFAAEDVACITVTYGTWSETALIDDQEGIIFLIDKMNQIEICPVNTVRRAAETAPGNGHDRFLFEMKDGKVKNDGVVMYNELTTVLIDKYEEGSKKPLKGATLKILDENTCLNFKEKKKYTSNIT